MNLPYLLLRRRRKKSYSCKNKIGSWPIKSGIWRKLERKLAKQKGLSVAKYLFAGMALGPMEMPLRQQIKFWEAVCFVINKHLVIGHGRLRSKESLIEKPGFSSKRKHFEPWFSAKLHNSVRIFCSLYVGFEFTFPCEVVSWEETLHGNAFFAQELS